MKKRVEPLARKAGSNLVLPCDVTDDASMDRVFETIGETWGGLDFLVHAIAFSDKKELTGGYLNTSAENFARTLDISCYSFTALAARAVELMSDGGSILTLTYLGAERVIPHYNVMGVAKAALEASVRALAMERSLATPMISPLLPARSPLPWLIFPSKVPVGTTAPPVSLPRHPTPMARVFKRHPHNRMVFGSALSNGSIWRENALGFPICEKSLSP